MPPGGWGYVYTAYTIYEGLECKPDEVGPAEKLLVGCYIAGLSQRRYIYNLCICLPPGELL